MPTRASKASARGLGQRLTVIGAVPEARRCLVQLEGRRRPFALVRLTSTKPRMTNLPSSRHRSLPPMSYLGLPQLRTRIHKGCARPRTLTSIASPRNPVSVGGTSRWAAVYRSSVITTPA